MIPLGKFQKQPSGGVLCKKASLKVSQIHRKTPVPDRPQAFFHRRFPDEGLLLSLDRFLKDSVIDLFIHFGIL